MEKSLSAFLWKFKKKANNNKVHLNLKYGKIRSSTLLTCKNSQTTLHLLIQRLIFAIHRIDIVLAKILNIKNSVTSLSYIAWNNKTESFVLDFVDTIREGKIRLCMHPLQKRTVLQSWILYCRNNEETNSKISIYRGIVSILNSYHRSMIKFQDLCVIIHLALNSKTLSCFHQFNSITNINLIFLKF